MKIGGNVITYYWKEDKTPDRLRDVLCYELFGRGVIKAHDYWTIEDDKGQIVGAFYSVTGPKHLVNFLSWLTNLSFGNTHKVEVKTDEEGTIRSCKDHSG